MEKNHGNCLDSKEAYEYFFKHQEMPLYLTDYIKSKVEQLKNSEHSDNYVKERIRIYKHLYCKLADSEKLHAYSRNSSLIESGKVPNDVEKEVWQIIKKAEDLLHETRDIDKYHLEGIHWMENREILWNFKDYLSVVYQIPVGIMITPPKKPFWELFREYFKFR